VGFCVANGQKSFNNINLPVASKQLVPDANSEIPLGTTTQYQKYPCFETLRSKTDTNLQGSASKCRVSRRMSPLYICTYILSNETLLIGVAIALRDHQTPSFALERIIGPLALLNLKRARRQVGGAADRVRYQKNRAKYTDTEWALPKSAII
jgi:hypothetical protein